MFSNISFLRPSVTHYEKISAKWRVTTAIGMNIAHISILKQQILDKTVLRVLTSYIYINDTSIW